MKIRAVIVNWNGHDQIVRAIEALRASDLPVGGEMEIVVVDNGSTDGSLLWLRQAHTSHALHLVELGLNRGFARACNAGAHDYEGDLLLFLNPDTRIEPDAMRRAMAVFEGDDSDMIGSVGIQSVGDGNQVQRTCTRFPKALNFINDALGLSAIFPKVFPGLLRDDIDHSKSKIVDHVIGAFYMTRNQLFRQLGGFDERFFVYLEDLDFSRRANQSGHVCFFLADATMYHKGGGISEKMKDRRQFYALRSRILYAFKHFTSCSAWCVALATLMVEPVPRLLRALLRRSAAEARDAMRAFGMLYRDLPGIFSSR